MLDLRPPPAAYNLAGAFGGGGGGHTAATQRRRARGLRPRGARPYTPLRCMRRRLRLPRRRGKGRSGEADLRTCGSWRLAPLLLLLACVPPCSRRRPRRQNGGATAATAENGDFAF